MKLWIKIKGEFVEVMEMYNYPFDTQALTFTIGIQCNINGVFPVEFIADKDELDKDGHSLEDKCNVQKDGLDLVNTEYSFKGIDPEAGVSDKDGILHKDVRAFPRLHIQLMVQRKQFYAMINMMLPMACVVILCFLQFSIPVDEVADRISVGITLLLTAAAYKYAITSMVPQISYLTMLDKYVLLCTVFIFFLVLESGIVGRIATIEGSFWQEVMMLETGDTEDVRMLIAVDVDAKACYTMMGLFAIFQLVYFWRMRHALVCKCRKKSKSAKVTPGDDAVSRSTHRNNTTMTTVAPSSSP
jgi:hypothetical protein